MKNTTIVATIIGSFALGVGAASVLHAASEPYAITVSEISVKDMDAYKTKDADPRQLSRELVLQPSSLASGEVEHLLRPLSDLSVSSGTMQVVPEGGHPGAIAA
jgi:hypothetical protein